MSTFEEKENVEPKTIATYALQCISEHDRCILSFCQEIINAARHRLVQNKMSIYNATSLLDILEIGNENTQTFDTNAN